MRKPLVIAAALVFTLSACGEAAPEVTEVSSPTPPRGSDVTTEAAPEQAEADAATSDFTMPPPAPTWNRHEDAQRESVRTLIEAIAWTGKSDDEKAKLCGTWSDERDGLLDALAASWQEGAEDIDREIVEEEISNFLDVSCEGFEAPVEPAGTRADPLHPETSEATFRDGANTYTVSVGYTDFDAWGVISAENMFNDEPGEGEVYAMVPITVTYEGPETMIPWLEVDVALVAANGRSYDQAFAVIPDELSDIADLYDGGTATGNIAFLVPQDAIEGSVYAVEVGWFSDPVFFRAEGQ